MYDNGSILGVEVEDTVMGMAPLDYLMNCLNKKDQDEKQKVKKKKKEIMVYKKFHLWVCFNLLTFLII